MKYLLSIALFFLSSTAHTEPSLQETINFIHEKIDVEWTDKNGDVSRKQKTNIKDCTLTLSKESSTYGRWATIQFSSSLADLDPSSVEIKDSIIGAPSVLLYTLKRDKKVSIFHEVHTDDVSGWLSHGYDCKKDSMDESVCSKSKHNVLNRITVNVSTPEEYNAPKVAKAFIHLIELCGGKGELF